MSGQEQDDASDEAFWISFDAKLESLELKLPDEQFYDYLMQQAIIVARDMGYSAGYADGLADEAVAAIDKEVHRAVDPSIDRGGVEAKRFIVRYGMPGHEYEYCVNIEGYSLTGEFIPRSLSDELGRRLGLPLLNRGSRLEIAPAATVFDPSPTPEQLFAIEAQIVSILSDLGLVNDPEGSFL